LKKIFRNPEIFFLVLTKMLVVQPPEAPVAGAFSRKCLPAGI